MNRQAIYKANVKTPFGKFVVAVMSTRDDAKTDIFTAAEVAFGCSAGLLRIGSVWQDNSLNDFTPIRQCYSSGEQWAWFAR